MIDHDAEIYAADVEGGGVCPADKNTAEVTRSVRSV